MRVEQCDLQHVIEAARSGRIAESKFARQGIHDGCVRTQELPIRLVNTMLRGKRLERLRRVRWLIETDADDIELTCSKDLTTGHDRALQRARGQRAYLKAAAVDKAHQQRLAAVLRQTYCPPGAIEQGEIVNLLADHRLAGAQSRDRIKPACAGLRPNVGWRCVGTRADDRTGHDQTGLQLPERQ